MAKGLTPPFDPSLNLESCQTFTKRATVFQEKDVKIEKSAQAKNSVVGSKTIIGDGAVIVNSIIGRNCTISPGAIIQESILWDNVVVESKVKLDHAIVAQDNSLKADHNLVSRVVLPRNTKFSPG